MSYTDTVLQRLHVPASSHLMTTDGTHLVNTGDRPVVWTQTVRRYSNGDWSLIWKHRKVRRAVAGR